MIRHFCDKCGVEIDDTNPLAITFHMPKKPGKERGFGGVPLHAKKEFFLCAEDFYAMWGLVHPEKYSVKIKQ